MPLSADKIVNIAVTAHVDAGKTTLTEQLLYHCGVIRNPGSVDKGTTQTDRMEIERERGISVKAAVTSLEWKGCAINMIDTPGHVDFAGEVERVFSALDGAILVISASEGIQSHTINLWKAYAKLNIPLILFLNKIDRIGSNVKRVFASLGEHFGQGFVMINRPLGECSRQCGIENAFAWESEALTEILADYDDDIANEYLEGRKISLDILQTHFRQAVAQRKIFPVLCGSAQNGIGVAPVLDAAVNFLPRAEAKLCDELSAVVFKLEHDRDMGKIAHVRLFGGKIKNRDMVLENEKVTQIRKWSGAKYTDIGEVGAGDIAALCGLTSVKCGSMIGSCAVSASYKLANPFLTVRVTPKNPADLSALVNAAQELAEEDPLMNYRWEKSEREINIDLTGKIQLEVISELLKTRYHLDTVFSPPSVIYKETPSKAGEGFEAYTMPKPCWAVVRFAIEPLARGSGVVYGGQLPHNQMFYKYQTHVKTSFFDSLEQGLYGWPVTDLKVTLIGGEHHTIHTHPLDFFVATPMALMNGLQNTQTTLLEPLLSVTIAAEEAYMGKITGDILLMRGTFDTPVIRNGAFTMEAILPVSSSMDYPIRLAAMTGGKATYFSSFYGYRDCPLELGATAKRRGINPLDRAKWILHARGAYDQQ